MADQERGGVGIRAGGGEGSRSKEAPPSRGEWAARGKGTKGERDGRGRGGRRRAAGVGTEGERVSGEVPGGDDGNGAGREARTFFGRGEKESDPSRFRANMEVESFELGDGQSCPARACA
nr:uncharacterized protein LOC127328650 [Lolium perenne]